MKRSTLIILKTLTWIACLGPMALLVYQAVTNTLGPDPTANIELTTGYNTLLLLILSLAVTPLRKLAPQLSWLIKFRRLLGLFAFFYGTVHMLTYVALYAGFNVQTMLDDIAKRKFITMGVAAWLLLVPLALTSTNWAIRKLGGKNWNRLHKLVYVAAVCVIPSIVSQALNVPFRWGGTSIMIVVGVALDVVQKVESHLLMRHYEGFMKTGRIRGRRN